MDGENERTTGRDKSRLVVPDPRIIALQYEIRKIISDNETMTDNTWFTLYVGNKEIEITDEGVDDEDRELLNVFAEHA